MSKARFERNFRRQSVFKCRICLRGTRDTGDNGGVELCPQCNEWSMWENGILDGCYDNNPEGLAKCEAGILKLKEEAAKLGGDRNLLGLSTEAA